MMARSGMACVIALAVFLAGCGGKEEVKKNKGIIVNVAPTAATPGGGEATSGAPPANKGNAPPPIPKIDH